MHTVILRDDDTNALTPPWCLDLLYRPFLNRGLPVNLAAIPEVRANAKTPAGMREGFLMGCETDGDACVPIATARELMAYLHANPGLHVVQHGCHHDPFEFDKTDRGIVGDLLERGRQKLEEAGFTGIDTFVAPHDRLSRTAFAEVARRFRVISTGWFEWQRLPLSWRARYAMKKLSGRPHWRHGKTLLLSHPGCLLSRQRNRETILPLIRRTVAANDLTVLVTHWWEYFPGGRPDLDFIRTLHETADYLASTPDVQVIPFSALTQTAHPFKAKGPPAERLAHVT